MTEHKSYSKALQMHSIRVLQDPPALYGMGRKTKMSVTPKNKNKNVFNIAFVGVTGLRLSLCFLSQWLMPYLDSFFNITMNTKS